MAENTIEIEVELKGQDRIHQRIDKVLGLHIIKLQGDIEQVVSLLALS